MTLRIYAVIFTLVLFSSAVFAEAIPESFAADPHIQTVTYDPDQVYLVTGMQGYTTAIEFSPDEDILSVNIGDSSAWLVNVQANEINLKPITENPATNMNVVTSRGNYQFNLTATSAHHDAQGHVIHQPSSHAIFLLRFRYPQVGHGICAQQHTSQCINRNYTARGEASIAPISVYDDGCFTYFNFGCRCRDLPAIFQVDPCGKESIVNYHVQGNYVVVETTGRQFTLRKGSLVASIFNEAAQ